MSDEAVSDAKQQLLAVNENSAMPQGIEISCFYYTTKASVAALVNGEAVPDAKHQLLTVNENSTMPQGIGISCFHYTIIVLCRKEGGH